MVLYNTDSILLSLNECIKEIFQDENERCSLIQSIGNFFLSNDVWTQKISKILDPKELKESQDLFGETILNHIQVLSYDSETKKEEFFDYFSSNPNLKQELIEQISKDSNKTWLKKMFESQTLYFLVSDSHWKNPKKEKKIRINLVLIGKKENPTIELSIY